MESSYVCSSANYAVGRVAFQFEEHTKIGEAVNSKYIPVSDCSVTIEPLAGIFVSHGLDFGWREKPIGVRGEQYPLARADTCNAALFIGRQREIEIATDCSPAWCWASYTQV
jgi:hypothetical protein